MKKILLLTSLLRDMVSIYSILYHTPVHMVSHIAISTSDIFDILFNIYEIQILLVMFE